MWTLNRPGRVTQAARTRQLGIGVVILACAGLSACTGAEAPSPASTTDARTVAPLPGSGDIDAGTYVVTGFTVPFEVTVPDGWSTPDGDGLGKDDMDNPGEDAVFLTFWPADYVPTEACAWRGRLVEVDPSAEAFVDAMTAQTSTASTPPVGVMVGDYSGFEFDHSVEGVVDIAACDDGKFCVRSEEPDICTRWYSSAAERETYRVVDLNGERAVIGLTQFHESITPELAREARAVFDSIAFIGGRAAGGKGSPTPSAAAVPSASTTGPGFNLVTVDPDKNGLAPAEQSTKAVAAWAELYCKIQHLTPCTGIEARAVPLCIEKWDCHPALLVPFEEGTAAFVSGGIFQEAHVFGVWQAESAPAVAPFGGARKLLEAYLLTVGVCPDNGGGNPRGTTCGG